MRRHLLTIPALLIAFGAGCASGTMGRVAQVDSLPSELPEDLKGKFEVTDVSDAMRFDSTPDPVPPATPDPTLTPVDKKRKVKTKAKGTLAVAPSPTPAFVYPVRRSAKDPIWVGEKMVFDITYFGMSAGDFTLEALPYKAVNNRKVYHLKGTAQSSKVFSVFYRLNDTVESFIDYDGIFSHRFRIVLDESKQSRDSLELYDSEKKQTFFWNRWNHKERGYTETKEWQPIEPFSQDSVSALYYLRTVPLPENGVVNVPVVSEGKSWEAVVHVVRRESCRTPWGKSQCVVLRPDTKFQGVLQKKGDSFLWITDDERRVVVRLEAKVRIGTVIAQLKQFEPGTPPGN